MDHTNENSVPKRLHEAAWPDMFTNLHTAYAELARAQFELERRTAEIEETRDLFQRVIESMSEALFLMDLSGRVVRANPAAAALLERSYDDIIGKRFSDICSANEIPGTAWQLPQWAPGGALPNQETQIRTRSGRIISIGFSSALVRDKRGKITGVLVVAHDITQRKQAEEDLQRSFHQLQAIYSLSKAVSHAESLEEIYTAALNSLKPALGTDRAAILLFDPDGRLRFKAWLGLSEDYRRAVEGHSPWLRDAEDQQPILVSNALEEPSVA